MSSEVQKHVTDFFYNKESNFQNPKNNFVLIVLNNILPPFISDLWDQTRLRICADGGANRIFDELPIFFPLEDKNEVRKRFIPDVIIGDLDSIRSEVFEYYQNLGVTIINLSDDQDSTDLHKCINFVEKKTPNFEAGQVKILVVGGTGGRVDHEFANLNILFMFPDLEIVLIDTHNVVFLLKKGIQHLIIPNLEWEGPHCGLIPIGESSKSSTTTGLQWNLNNTPMQFGALVSTSNRISSSQIFVKSDVNLVWTVEVKKTQKSSK